MREGNLPLTRLMGNYRDIPLISDSSLIYSGIAYWAGIASKVLAILVYCPNTCYLTVNIMVQPITVAQVQWPCTIFDSDSVTHITAQHCSSCVVFTWAFMHITHWNIVAGQGLFFSSGRKAFSDFTSWKLL